MAPATPDDGAPHSPSDSDGTGSGGLRGRATSLTKRAERYKRIATKKLGHKKTATPSEHSALAAGDGESSPLQTLVAAWGVALRDSSDALSEVSTGDDSTEPGGNAPAEMRIEPLLGAFEQALQVAGSSTPLERAARADGARAHSQSHAIRRTHPRSLRSSGH